MNIGIVLILYGLALVLASSLALYNRLDLRRMEKEIWHALTCKADKRRSSSSDRKKHVPANPVHQTSPDGKDRIVGYLCTVCLDPSVSKGGHSVAACERYQEEQSEEQLKSAQPEEAHDPPMDNSPAERPLIEEEPEV